MKRKRNSERADRENPAWPKETFARAQGSRGATDNFWRRCSNPHAQTARAAKIRQRAYVHFIAIASGYVGTVEGHRAGLAYSNG
jgi:hypothetical protein